MAILIFFLAHWYLSLFAQTFFLHRYAAHRMFTMSKTWEKVFYWLTYIFQGSSFLSPKAYGIMHRLHHAYADTANDPHSPKYSANLPAMMWKTKEIYHGILDGSFPVEKKFLHHIPDWKFMEKLGDNWMSRVAWGTAYSLFYIYFAADWWLFLLLPVHYLMGPVHGAIINWFAHKWGYRNYEVNDTARNLLPLDVLMMGESYHNNHHKFGGRPNFGVRWFEIDPTYPFILLFNRLGIIKLRGGSELEYM